jgi:hypothetical protein
MLFLGGMRMSETPSIKGSVFAGVVEGVQKMLSEGEIGRADLSRWLYPSDIELLDQNISISSWYDIQSYQRMGSMLRDVVGGGSNEYLRAQGRETARRLLEAGLYSQLEYLHNTQVRNADSAEARFAAFGRDLRRLTTLSASILNFSCWTARPDPSHPKRYSIEISAARHFPEVLCWRSDGFVNEMATQHGDPDLWSWDRPSADLVVFRMKRSL